MTPEFDKDLNRKNRFVYPKINIKCDVRLLRIIRDGRPGGTFACRLVTVKLSDLARSRYRALSYVWGHATNLEDVRMITVDGQPFCVRQNLYDFLRVAVAKGEFGLFFIDAICINQLDGEERCSQVTQMARVYRNANMVVAWLGALDPEQQFENVRSLSLDRGKNCSSWSASQWTGLRYLSYHPYWSRIWIIQEVLLATSMVIWCGPFTFPLSLLRSSLSRDATGTRTRHDFRGRPTSVSHQLSQSNSPAESVITHRLREVTASRPDPLAQGTEVGTLEEMTRALRRPHSVTVTYQSHMPDLLHQIMGKFGRLDCSDSRDKLYGLLGLLKERSSLMIQPNYEKGVDFALSQALATGIDELLSERLATISTSSTHGGIGTDDSFFIYYCNVRDAFGMKDAETIPVLQRVLQDSRERHNISDSRDDERWFIAYNMMEREFEGLLEDTLSTERTRGNLEFEKRFHRKLLGIW
ncbi:heterokaryon incompatibility protein-domain-containing protein [Apiospora rasikravindrae]|uniref:Heterokaryon incompatibility protein-domain-containing protein n=1 Tax=Apiospora rasikravindrae TaxID=990691 RepID=A0ABR1SCY1_9PEZI